MKKNIVLINETNMENNKVYITINDNKNIFFKLCKKDEAKRFKELAIRYINKELTKREFDKVLFTQYK